MKNNNQDSKEINENKKQRYTKITYKLRTKLNKRNEDKLKKKIMTENVLSLCCTGV